MLRMTFRSICYTVTCFFLLAGGTQAQYYRSARYWVHHLPGDKAASINPAGVLWNQVHGEELATGIAFPAFCLRVKEEEHVFLASGRTAEGDGVVQHWKRVGENSYTLVSSFVQSQADFVAVAYDPDGNLLYLMDGKQKRILRAAWNGNDPLPAGGWTTWATPATVPDLEAAKNLVLLVLPAFPSKVYMESCFSTPIEAGLLLWESGGSIQTEAVWLDQEILAGGTEILAEERSATEGGTTVEVSAPGGTLVEMVRLMSPEQVVGSATVPPQEHSVVVGLNEPLVLGAAYAARVAGTPTNAEHRFFAMRRYGHPETFADGTALQRIPYPHNFRRGNASFMLVVGALRAPPPASEKILTGVLAVALRDANGQDPVVPYGDNQLLVTDVFLPASGSVGKHSGQGGAHANLPIPNDPSLDGLVVLFQFLMQDGETFLLSEVAGLKLEAVPEGEGVAGGGVAGSGSLEDLLQDAGWFRDVELLRRILAARK